jgi:hypothetical protein
MGRSGQACACSAPGAKAIPSNNANPATCFIAVSPIGFSQFEKQVLCR